ncbi:MAG: hypothetical protein AAGB93_11445 [Planctomycetota bacterium]
MSPLHTPPAPRRTRAALAGLLTAFVGGGTPLPAQDRPLAPDTIRIEWAPPEAPVYAGQTFDLRLDVLVAGGVDGAGLLQLFPQPMELPLQVEGYARVDRIETAPWPASDPTAPNLVVDGAVAAAEGPFTFAGDPEGVVRYRVSRSVRVPRSGRIDLASPTARYAVATAFRDDFVQGRVPVDRIERTARGAAAALDVLPLPEEGRPMSFDGAIGRFELVAAVEPRTAEVGESLSLRVLVVGATPQHAVPSPQVDSAGRVDVLGMARRDVDGGTEFTFDVVARSTDVLAMPPISLTVFDPTADPPAYAVLTAPELPVSIRPAAPPANAAPGDASGDGGGGAALAPEASGQDGGEDDDGGRLLWTPLVLGMILSLAFLSVVRRRMLTGGGAGSPS